MKIIKNKNILKDNQGLKNIKTFDFTDLIVSDINLLSKSQMHILNNQQNNNFIRDIEEVKINEQEIKEEAKNLGREEGYKKGFEEGYLEAIKQIDFEINLIKKIKEELIEYKKEIIKKLEPEMLKLSQYIAEKIIRQNININPALILNTFNFAVKQVSHLDKIIVYLNPEDYEYLKANKNEIQQIINDFEEIKFLEDRRIEKGGCVIETENGNLDSQPSSQLKILNRIFTDNLNYS
jgi:flagellar assembly protein FliH